jgi:hypothetical protein
MYIHPEAKLCYLATPRTASRAVRDALLDPLVGFGIVGDHHDGPENGYDLTGLNPFTVVRNPWDMVVSWWFNARMHKKQEKPSLVWIANHFAQNRGYFWPGRMYRFSKVPGIINLRYENLGYDLNVLLEARGLPKVELPRVGVSEEREGRHYSTFYDHDTRHFVEWCFLEENRTFRYCFREDPAW